MMLKVCPSVEEMLPREGNTFSHLCHYWIFALIFFTILSLVIQSDHFLQSVQTDDVQMESTIITMLLNVIQISKWLRFTKYYWLVFWSEALLILLNDWFQMIFTWYLKISIRKLQNIFRNIKISSTYQDKIHARDMNANKQENRTYNETNQLIKTGIYVIINR